MEEKLTIDDIAKALNVSKTTVSRAISGKGRISEGTRARVEAYIEKHNYKPNSIAKSLAESKSYNIGFVMPKDFTITDLTFYQKCLWGINQVAVENDYDVLVSMVAPDDLSQLSRLIENRKIDGAILGRTSSTNVIERFLRSQALPFVTVGSSVDSSVLQVDNDHEAACNELTTKLLKNGVRNIALIGGDTQYIVNRNRKRGFIRAFENADLQLHEELIFTEGNSQEYVENAVDEAIKNGADCIIAIDDDVCVKVINSLEMRGIKIPNEMGIASFYNSYLLENAKVPVTAVSFDEIKLGQVSCKTLIDQINQEEPIKKVLLGYKIELKASTMKQK